MVRFGARLALALVACLAVLNVVGAEDAGQLPPGPETPLRPSADPALLIGIYKMRQDGVVDGDTFRVEGRKKSLRLLSIDTEEMPRPQSMKPALQKLMREEFDAYRTRMAKGRIRPAKYPTPMGEAATRWAIKRLPPRTKVRLERDHAGQGTGTYGRTLCLAWIYPESGAAPWLYNVEVVRAGLSPYTVKYGRSQRFDAAFRAAQAEARAARRGIWNPETRHYPDYEDRLAWWKRRARSLKTIEILRKNNADLVVLGGRTAIQTLTKKLAGGPGPTVQACGLVAESDDRAFQIHERGATVKVGGRYAIDIEIVGQKLAKSLGPKGRLFGYHVLAEGPLDREGSPIRLRDGRTIRSLRIVVTRSEQLRLVHELPATDK